MKKQKVKCKLCGHYFDNTEMSEEHYPAKSVGNNDIVQFNLIDMINMLSSEEIKNRYSNGESIKHITDDIFDNRIAKSLYPHGRTARTLCRKCNTFLGKYDEAYKKFFELDGNAKAIKGFNQNTKLQIIKSIFGKFLSLPEAKDEDFDFIEFLNEECCKEYSGKWELYFIKRDFSSDIMGLKDIDTGKLEFDEGVVYELSDDKFIYNLLNFPKHTSFKMTNIFDILQEDYTMTVGVGELGGYHAQILMKKLFSQSQ